ncbi:hypothetical protein EAE96_000124 [Botrytis aclada]|nr:hypothetical protein EAE96_000124 [Botrytis aclada]
MVHTVENELGPHLSKGSLIFGSSNAAYANLTSYWITYIQPDFEVIVEVAAESDISKVVRYCSDNSIDFLVRNRGHGITSSLNSFKGLQISMDKLQGLQIDAASQTVLLQGGVYAAPVIADLWDNGWVTSTGAAYCVGLVGLSLGGGHGRLEGLYGLVADGIVHFNLVLANGNEIGVNAKSHADLFWALKGAGHNFGVVTSYRAKIYPKSTQTWHYHSYVWTGDKLEAVFEALNDLHTKDNGTMPVLMSFETGFIAIDLSISDTKPVFSWSFTYNGPAVDAEALLEPFNAIGAASENVQNVPYPDISPLQGTGEQNGTCSDGPYIHSTVLLIKYNVTAQRQLYNQFVQKITQYPDLKLSARCAHEGYSNKAVQAISSDSTAYPHRESNIMVYFLAAAAPGSSDQAPAKIWAQEARALWIGNDKPQTYVNYASGNSYESLKSVYGYEPWRLNRLRGLKAKYDPHNRFRYYEPIVSH